MIGKGRREDSARRLYESGSWSGLLLIVLVATYLLSAFISAKWVDAVQVLLFLGVVMVALRVSRLPLRIARLIMLTVAAVSAIMIGASLTGGIGEGIGDAWKALMMLLAVATIIRRVLLNRRVTIQSLYQATSAYLVIGLMFAACYAALYHFGTGDFFAHHQPSNTKTFQYFSFTTLTTLGYGDFTALTAGARAVAVVEAVIGQVFLVTLLAYLVTEFRRPTATDRL